MSSASGDESCGCPRDCEAVRVATKVDRAQLDPEIQCRNEGLRMMAFQGVNTAADHAGWVFDR